MSEKIEDKPSMMPSKKELEVYTWTQGRCVDLGILLELGSIGAGHAATSLSDVLQQQIAIDVPRIHTIPAHLVTKFYQKHDSPTTALYMQLREESECDILLMFDVSEAKKIAAMMTMAASPEEVDPAMEASAIEELANILIGSFLSSISDFTGAKLVPTPPQRVVDSFDAIMDNLLVKQSMVSHEALIFDACFKRADGSASCILMIFPSIELKELLVRKSKELIDEAGKKDESIIVCPPDAAINIAEAATAEKESKHAEG